MKPQGGQGRQHACQRGQAPYAPHRRRSRLHHRARRCSSGVAAAAAMNSVAMHRGEGPPSCATRAQALLKEIFFLNAAQQCFP